MEARRREHDREERREMRIEPVEPTEGMGA